MAADRTEGTAARVLEEPGRGRVSGVGALVFCLTSLLLLARIVEAAWVGEDAFITFRVIDNLVNGYGLRWNVDERVMVYTHPLWMMINAALYFLSREVAYSTTALAAVLSLAAYAVVWRQVGGRSLLLVGALFLPRHGSSALIRYSTSGFETSLTMFLIAVFSVALCGETDGAARTPWGVLASVSALLGLNRPDLLLLAAPPLALLLFVERRGFRVLAVLAGFLPLLAWTGFSFLYYGFPYPNTAPAKLSSAFPVTRYLALGAGYAGDLVRNDPVSALTMVGGAAVATVCALSFRTRRRDRLPGRVAALGLGAFLYALYVVRVGGDFLAGRLWVPSIFAFLMVIVFGLPLVAEEVRRRPRWILVCVAIVVSMSVGTHLALSRWSLRGPIHERSVAHLRLRPDLRWQASQTAQAWRKKGEEYSARARATPGKLVVQRSRIGFTGYFAGPEVTIIDAFGLGDALLARLPPDQRRRWAWRVGHLPRAIPAGYAHARRIGSLVGMEPGLREYYRKLALVVSGPVLSWERLKTIVVFQVGGYDHLLSEVH